MKKREKQGSLGRRKRGPLFSFCWEGSAGAWSSITMLGLQIETSEATGAQTQDADSLSASRSFFFPKEN